MMVATDGSESACGAIDYTARQAKESGAELLIVNVIGGYGRPGNLLEQFTGAQQAWLKEMPATLSWRCFYDLRSAEAYSICAATSRHPRWPVENTYRLGRRCVLIFVGGGASACI